MSTKTLQHQVIEFHQAFDHPIRPAPTADVPEAEVRLRALLVVEEALEFVESLFLRTERMHNRLADARALLRRIIEDDVIDVKLTEAADALADIAYVTEGSNLVFGIDSTSVAAEVHRANMDKRGSVKSAEGKTLKPVGWTPPNIAGVLAQQAKYPDAFGLEAVLIELADDDEDRHRGGTF